MSFGSPYFLLGLLLVPLVAVGYMILERRRRRRASAWTNQALLPNLVLGGRPGGRRHIPISLFVLGLAFLLVGFAQPQRKVSSVSGRAPTVVVTIDVSGSMAATDVLPSRIKAARAIATRLIQGLPANERVAVETFGDKAKVLVSPTLDHKLAIAKLPAAITPLAGTAIGDGVKEAVAVIVQGAGIQPPGGRPGAVIVVSDGVQTAGGSDLQDAALNAHTAGIPVDAVAVGTPHGVVTQTITTPLGRKTSQLAAPVDTASLRSLAQETSGTFISSPTTQNLKVVSGELGSGSSRQTTTRNLAGVAGIAAFALIVAAIALSGAWFGRIA